MQHNTKPANTLFVKVVTVKSPTHNTPISLRLIAGFSNDTLTVNKAAYIESLPLRLATVDNVNSAAIALQKIANARSMELICKAKLKP
jgi:hypothetical protein